MFFSMVSVFAFCLTAEYHVLVRQSAQKLQVVL